MDGVLVIDKPAGPTSHDIVARVRRATGWARVGHTGTLDPLATGVLPLVIGRATRLAQFLTASEKVYEADIRLGCATDTYDSQGQPMDITGLKCHPNAAAALGAPAPCATGPARTGQEPAGQEPAGQEPTERQDVAQDFSPAQLEQILDRFRGSYLQVAPPFSAKKIDGVRSYALARQGAPVAAKASQVTVHELTCLERSAALLKLRLRCSAGFYVRSFAHELGVALGVGAHLCALRRTRSGTFDAAQAVPIDTIEQERAGSAARLLPLERLLPGMPAVVVNEAGAGRVRHGNDVRPADIVSPAAMPLERVQVVDERGVLLAIAEPSARRDVLHPGIVVV